MIDTYLAICLEGVIPGNEVFAQTLVLKEFLFVDVFRLTGEVIRLRDVKDFPLTLWLIFIICVSYYVAIFPFIGLGL